LPKTENAHDALLFFPHQKIEIINLSKLIARALFPS
jgi:hypothetical protein